MKSPRWLVLIALLLAALALLELSAISPRLFQRQTLYLALALLTLGVTARIPLRVWKYTMPVLYGLGLLSLALVLFVGRGAGAQRWIPLGPFHWQPAETMKLLLILTLAYGYERRNDTWQMLKMGVLTLLPMGLVLLEPDLATALTYFVIYAAVSLVMGRNLVLLLFLTLPPLAVAFSFNPWSFVVFLGVVLILLYVVRVSPGHGLLLVFLVTAVGLLSPVLVDHLLHDYQKARIVAFLNPEKYRQGPGWQTLQARIALGSGGLLGKGYRQGTQKGLAFLPEAHTDFIFTSIGEEFGFVATAMVMLLFVLFFWGLASWADTLESPVFRGIAAGVLGFFLYHTATNLATNLGMFPVTGIPLPFMTYGGSHLITEFAALGVLLRVAREAREPRFSW